MSWCFSLRTTDYESDSDSDQDDAEQLDADTSDTRLLQEIDISLREETVVYKPNPFSIAKINAAARTTRSAPPEKLAPRTKPLPKKPTGRIVDCFKAQKSVNSLKKPLPVPSAQQSHSPTPIAIERPVSTDGIADSDSTNTLHGDPMPPVVPSSLKVAHIPTLDEALTIHAPPESIDRTIDSTAANALLDPNSPHVTRLSELIPTTFRQMPPINSKPVPSASQISNRLSPPPRLADETAAIHALHGPTPRPLPTLTLHQPDLNRRRNASQSLSSPTRIPRRSPHKTSFSSPSHPSSTLLDKFLTRPRKPDPQLPPRMKPNRRANLPTLQQSKLSSEFRNKTRLSQSSLANPVPVFEPQPVVFHQAAPVSPIVSQPAPVPRWHGFPPSSPFDSPIPSPDPSPPRARKAPPPKLPPRPVKRQRSNDAYDYLRPDPDQQWSTLPNRKKVPETRKPGIQTTKAFRMPLVAPMKGKPTGMSATSAERVITFLPPPKESGKVEVIVEDIVSPSSDHDRETRKRARASSTSSVTPKRRRVDAVSPIATTSSTLSSGSSPAPFSPRTSRRHLNSSPDSDPISEFPEPSQSVKVELVSRRYALVQANMKRRRRCSNDMWTMLGLPSCGKVYEDKDELCEELPIIVWHGML
ncbi:hypothetical protein C8F01DRAFT_399980 [Mycena amicta]|nr:hypothetical protein C8F01DRAFT_399980 [Mycena amicta]